MKKIYRFIFPKQFFPSRKSVVAFLVIWVCMLTLIMTLAIMPTLHKEIGKVYEQPRQVNSVAFVGFLGAMTLYALERQSCRPRR